VKRRECGADLHAYLLDSVLLMEKSVEVMGKLKPSKAHSKSRHMVVYASAAKQPKPSSNLVKLQPTKHGGVKKKAFYGLQAPASLKLHDAGEGMVLAEPPVAEEEPSSVDQETKLAERLVDHIDQTSSDVKELCDTYGLRREELGRLTGFSLRALAEWASGRLPSQPAKRRLTEVRRLLDSLSELVKREKISDWLHRPIPAFAPLTPLQVIELGEIDRLWAMVHDLGSGQPD